MRHCFSPHGHSQLFCRVVLIGERVEFHCSRIRSKVEANQAMNRAILASSPDKEDWLAELRFEIRTLKMAMVPGGLLD